jgi:hypothetical protein
MAARKGVLDKTRALRMHAKRQALLRYGIELSDDELRHVANLVRRGEGLFVSRKSLRVSCWRVFLEGREMVVLYDRQRSAIVTFLPLDCWEMRQGNCPFGSHSRPQDGAAL